MGIDEEGQRLIFLVHLQGIYWGTGISLLKKKNRSETITVSFPLLAESNFAFQSIPHAKSASVYAARLTQGWQ